MKREKLWIVIAGLILLNCITAALLIKNDHIDGSEAVATVGKEKVTRQDWLSEMESRYGKETLEDLIDQKVIESAGKKYGIKVSKKAVEREMKMIKTMYGSSGGYQSADEEKWLQQIQNNLILEELMTKDVKVSEKEMKKYYEEHTNLFHLPDSYHISKIVVLTKEEAEQTEKELKNGSSFSVLAMERSIDEFTAYRGGDSGFISEKGGQYSKDFIANIKNVKPGSWSKPIKVDKGYAIVMVHEHVKGENYSFKEVKDQIRRQIALEQMGTPVSAKPFWQETDVEWFYGNKE